MSTLALLPLPGGLLFRAAAATPCAFSVSAVTAMHFVTLLRAEHLDTLPRNLANRIRKKELRPS